MLNLICNCNFHKIIIEKIKLYKDLNCYTMIIEQHRSFQTGKLLKKPKLVGDVVLTEEQFKLLKNYD